MKKIPCVFLLACSFFIFCSSCRAKCEMLTEGKVHLHVLDENGNPLPDTYETNLIVRHSNRDGYQGSSSDGKNPSPVLNEQDALIFQLGSVEVSYNDCKRLKNRDAFTEEELKNALNGAGVFDIKDKTDVYKTIAKAKYSDHLKTIEKLGSEDAVVALNAEYIYHLEIKLERK